MNISRTTAIVLRHFYLIRGSPSRIIPIFAWGTIDIVLWGFITKYLNAVTAATAGINFVAMFLGAVLLWSFFIRTMQGVTMTFFEDVWSRNFLNIFATPLSISEYLSGLVLSSIVTSIIAFIILLLVAMTVFGFSIMVYGIMIIPFLLVLFLSGIAFGIFGTAVVLRLGPAAEWFIWPIPAIISPFVGVFYPITTLPIWMQCISRLLPPSYVFEGIRKVVLGGSVSETTLAIGGGLAIVFILLACWFFSRIYHHAVRTGLIARYSAETVS
ncbi:MAG: ABC transporter permease [bacterium]